MLKVEYIAGFFDGEGSIGVYKQATSKSNFYLRTQLTQNGSIVSLPVLKELALSWQATKPLVPARTKNGRIAPHIVSPLDYVVSQALKNFKAGHDVMSAQSDLVDIVFTLKQVCVVKG